MELACEFEPPDARPVSERHYRLYAEYCYCWVKDEIQNRILVPEGFTYDGASVPRLLWTVSGLRPDGLLRAAAVVHDWIYGHAGRLPENTHEYLDGSGSWRPVHARWRRVDADRLFARMMREAGVSTWRRRGAYLAVRLFGRSTWDS